MLTHVLASRLAHLRRKDLSRVLITWHRVTFVERRKLCGIGIMRRRRRTGVLQAVLVGWMEGVDDSLMEREEAKRLRNDEAARRAADEDMARRQREEDNLHEMMLRFDELQ